MSTELEKLLTEDPYVVTVKPKEDQGAERTRAKGPVIRDVVPEVPARSQRDSDSDSSSKQQQEPSESKHKLLLAPMFLLLLQQAHQPLVGFVESSVLLE